MAHTWRNLRRGQYIWRQRAKAWLQQRRLMAKSAAAIEFESFKNKRARLAPPDLSALSVPAAQGLVSIVLPVYNGQDYVGEAVDSVLAQSYEDFELIVVDDGSTDRTPQILAEHAHRDPRVRIVTQANQKLPRALSNGFELAGGEFLTWTSADNRLRPEFLEKMVDCLRRHPSWDMIYANQDIIGQDGRPLRGSEWFWPYQRPLGSEHIYWPRDTSELNMLGNNYVGAAFLYRARVRFLLGDYSPERFGLEDYDYWMRVNALLTLRHADFDEPVYDYRLHEDSLTSRHADLHIEDGRRELVAFDAVRRQRAVEPLTWDVQPRTGSPRVASLARGLESSLRAMGHSVAERAEAHSHVQAHVHVSIVDDLQEYPEPPHDLPAHALRVLIVHANHNLPPIMPEHWDLYAAWSSPTSPPIALIAPPPRLPRDRQGWLTTDRLETLVAAVDIRARSHLPNPPA